MRVDVKSDDGELLWAVWDGPAGQGGITSRTYGADGTLRLIQIALAAARQQLDGELAVFDVADGIFDMRAATS